jgi:ectoine hydroxylase-related dioxygenase (phytanoyl-CoA dioxygenase family)
MRLEVTGREVDARRLEGETLQAAVEALRVDGYVVLGGVVDLAELDAMKRKLDEDTAELLRRARRDGAGEMPLHLSQSMPRSVEHIHADVVTNPLVIQVTAEMLGEGVHNHFYNGNTNMPGSQVQPLHRDAPYLWPDPVHPVTSIVVNISPIDVDEAMGATELWPGTHRILGSTAVTAAAEEERRAVVPPVRAVTRKGDAVLRDPRLWHRGVANSGTEVRHMVAMVHSKWFYQRDTAIPVTRGALHAFDHDILTTRVELVPDDYDYLSEVVQARSW